MCKMIPLSAPSLKGNEWKYVKECLDMEWISSSGSYIEKFEKELGKYVKTKNAVACASGTSALQISLQLVGVCTDDEVIVPTLTFIATVNAVRYLGAHPIFMDCDDYYNIETEKTIDFLNTETVYKNGYTYNKTTKRRISAIIPVHVFGNAVHLSEILQICRERNIRIVEDATESLGTFYNNGSLTGRHTGAIGDLGCFSFNGNKIITTGGGGMIVTDNDEYAERAKYLITQAKDDEIRYIHNNIGYNFRMTNIQAALGVAQLEKLPEFLEIKARNYWTFKNEIDKIPGLYLADGPPYSKNNYWMYPVRVDKDVYGKDREELMNHLVDLGIETRPVWYLNHLQKPYLGCQSHKIEKAFKMWEKTLNIPCSISLRPEEIQRVIEGLRHG